MDEDNFSKQNNLLELREIMDNALNEKSDDKFALRAFIIRLLKQFKLYQYDYPEILSDTAYRVKSRIESGEKAISNMLAYTRSTALNVIREHSRREKRNYQIQQKLSYVSHEYMARETYIVSPKIREQLEEAWRNLSLRYRIIVYNRAVRGYTFREINIDLFVRGLESACDKTTINTITRQYHRAICRLRNQIDQL